MTVRELYAELDRRIPRTLSCPWDNDGLLCCPDGQREVKRVLITLDVTARAVEYAIENGYDCIVSHHPFIFKGLKAIDEEGDISAKVVRLICEGISAMSFHTRLDAVEGGVNDTLCALLGLSDVEAFEEEGIPLGRVGSLECEMSAQELALKVKSVLGAPFVLLSDAGVRSKRVAVLGGSGKDVIEAARASGADTFVSGRLDYHPLTDGAEKMRSPMNLIEAGHFYTEQPICGVLKEMIESIDQDICCDVYSSNVIKAI
jgi:dinuclear metal center YbgI/SA1388 family protein